MDRRWLDVRRWLVLLCCALAVTARADGLSYAIDGLDEAQRENARAWLGASPVETEQRAAFLVTARERLRHSLEALGYYRADIDFDLDKSAETWRLQIDVDPGPSTRIERFAVSIRGEAKTDPAFEALMASLPLSRGAVFHHGRYESMKKSLLSLGQKRGYFDAMIERSRVEVESAAGEAEVELVYDSGARYHFGELRHDGAILDEQRLRALMPFAPGAPFEFAQVQAFQSQLQRTGFFSGVLVQPRVDQARDGLVPLDVELFPAKRHTFEVGLGYSTDTEERVSLVWRTPRLNRWGHSQETRLQYSAINPSGQFTYNIPLSHPLDDVLQFRARLERNEFGDLESDQRGLGLRRETRSGNWVRALSVRHLNERWRPLPTVVERTLRSVALERRGNYFLPGVTVAHTSRSGSMVNPREGLSQYYQLEGGSDQAGSDLNLLRAYARWVGVVSPGENHRLVARLEAGAVWVSESQRDALAPSLNFFAGGAQSLRGYSYQSIGREVRVTRPDGSERKLVVGGDRLLLGSLEYQYRFRDSWRAALFVDGGDAFDEGRFDANYGVGVGLHYMTPVGAIKLELANSISEEDPDWRVHINIGAEF